MSALDKLPDLTGLPPSALETMGYIAFGERVSSFTPYFILAWVDVFLLGVAFVVFAQWYTTCRRTDRKISQLLVYWIMIMACAFSGVYQGFMCFWFANGFGIYRNFFNAQWVKAVTILGAAVRVPAMVFYLHRAYALVHNRLWIVYLVALPIAYTAAAPIAQIWLLPLLPYTPTMQRILATSSACEVVADLCITTVISVQLYRSRTGWASTDRLITKLLFTIAETQTPPTIMASLTLILFYAIPNTSMQVLVIFSPKVTVLSILFTLLARVRLAEETRRDGFNNQSKSISGLSGSGSGSSSGAGGSSKFTSSNVSANGSMGMGTVYGDMKAKRGFGRNLGLGFGKRTQGHGQATNRVDRWGRSTAAGQGESFGSGSQGRTIDLGSNAELGFGAGRRGEVGRKESEEVMQVDKEGGSRVRLVSDNVGTAL